MLVCRLGALLCFLALVISIAVFDGQAAKIAGVATFGFIGVASLRLLVLIRRQEGRRDEILDRLRRLGD